MDDIFKYLLNFRRSIAAKLGKPLEHGEHIAHTAYLGVAAFARHEWVPLLAGFGFIIILVHFVLTGFGD